MSKQYRAVIEEHTYKTVFKLSDIPIGKTSFDTALNLILKKISSQNSKTMVKVRQELDSEDAKT